VLDPVQFGGSLGEDLGGVRGGLDLVGGGVEVTLVDEGVGPTHLGLGGGVDGVGGHVV
jgi:hypothetical protein